MNNPFTPLARTLLYEGQLLYPYRASALKNQRRETFGTLHPPGGAREPSGFRLEILIESAARPEPELLVCYIREGVEVQDAALARSELTPIETGLWRLAVEVEHPGGSDPSPMESAHLRCSLSVGGFVSAQDPPPERAAAAGQCRCRGVYPALAGTAPDRRFLLAAPIIVEDYARIAPQSHTEFCDAGEMDEMLMLRMMTLADSEIEEIRSARGPLASISSAILAQCQPGADPLASLHGVVSLAPPEAVELGAARLRVGDRVRVHPRSKRDIFDMALDGMPARIQAIEQDLEGNIQLAVVADHDPGRDLGELKQSGHRFFFSPDEIEPL